MDNKTREAKFITFEGGEGSGKSTQVKLLKKALAERSIDSVATREPGGSSRAELIRSLVLSSNEGSWDPLTETMLFTAARRDHILQVIKPALESGVWVISDRFYDSTLAYQGYAGGFDIDKIEELHRLACDNFQPDITFVLDVPVELGLQRAFSRRQTNRFEDLDLDFHQKVADGFLTIWEMNQDRCRRIDASGDINSVAAKVSVEFNL